MLPHVDAEILIPGARALVIDATVAHQVKAKVIAPISNAPVTLEGEEVLARADILSMPDIITNVGALIASFAQHLGADISQTKKLIVEIISQNLTSVFEDQVKRDIPKKKANAIALQRLEEITKSEKIGALRFLSPWIRNLGVKSMLISFKEYAALSFRS